MLPSGCTYENRITATPHSIHIVTADPKKFRVIPARALNNGLGRECLPTLALRHKAIAAINGGYFLVGGSFDGKSKGTLKIKDRWYSSPTPDCSSVAWKHNDLDVKMSRTGMIWKIFVDGIQFPIDGINIPLEPQTAVLYTWANHRSTLSPLNTIELIIYDQKLIAVQKPGGDSPIPQGGYVYCLAADHKLKDEKFSIGCSVEISPRIVLLNEQFEDIVVDKAEQAFWDECEYIMSGSPLLIQNNILTKDYDLDSLKPSILYSLQPRSAVGVKSDGTWVFVLVEGRQPRISIGMTIHELAHFMHELGCVNALNLDGGASCLMVVNEKIVNTPLFNGIESQDEEFGQRRISDCFIIVSR